jgi:hypothetical protein
MRLARTDGENSRTRKLNWQQVNKIRDLYAKGKRGKTEARKFGITPAHFDVVGKKKQWTESNGT